MTPFDWNHLSSWTESLGDAVNPRFNSSSEALFMRYYETKYSYIVVGKFWNLIPNVLPTNNKKIKNTFFKKYKYFRIPHRIWKDRKYLRKYLFSRYEEIPCTCGSFFISRRCAESSKL